MDTNPFYYSREVKYPGAHASLFLLRLIFMTKRRLTQLSITFNFGWWSTWEGHYSAKRRQRTTRGDRHSTTIDFKILKCHLCQSFIGGLMCIVCRRCNNKRSEIKAGVLYEVRFWAGINHRSQMHYYSARLLFTQFWAYLKCKNQSQGQMKWSKHNHFKSMSKYGKLRT